MGVGVVDQGCPVQALAKLAVGQDEDGSLAHDRRQHRLVRRRARTGDDHGAIPFALLDLEQGKQLVLNAGQQRIEIGFAMADIRFRNGIAQILGHIHRAGREKSVGIQMYKISGRRGTEASARALS